MSIISKIKMPGMANAYDIGVDWENVKDKPDVGSIDVGVTNEVLNIDTNNDIAVSGSSSSEIPAWNSSGDEWKSLTVSDAGVLYWGQPHEVFTLNSSTITYISSFFSKILNRDAHPTKKIFVEDLAGENLNEYLTIMQSNFIGEGTGNLLRTISEGHGFCIVKFNNKLYQSFLNSNGGLYINIPFMFLNNEGAVISGTLMFLEGGLGFSGLIDTVSGTTNMMIV